MIATLTLMLIVMIVSTYLLTVKCHYLVLMISESYYLYCELSLITASPTIRPFHIALVNGISSRSTCGTEFAIFR